MRNRTADVITCSRFPLALLMLICPVFSTRFCIIYLLGGLTDMIDGAVARKTGTESAAGARLDTIADFVFIAAAFIKILPALAVPVWLWIWMGVIAAIRTGNIIAALVRRKKPVAEHTVLNKLTGLMLFLLPVTLRFIDIRYSAAVICPVATIAAVQEWHIIRTGKETSDPGRR